MATDVLRYINLARKIKAKSETGQINWSPASLVETYEAGIYSSAESMQVRANGGSWLSGMETFVDAL